MKAHNKVLISFGVILFFITSIIILSSYKNNTNITLITQSNEIVEKYAKKNKYKIELLSDSNKSEYIKKIEQFDYKILDSGLEITSYKGASETLIIPSSIVGKKVISIAKTALDNPNVKDIILPKTILTYDIETSTKNIFCYSSNLCNNLKKKIENTTILDDSIKYDFNNTEIEYEYNEEDGIEITKYLGNDETIIIPTTINGNPITKISLNEETINNKKIYVPTTIKNLNIQKENNELNTYIYALVINAVALIIFVLSLMIIAKQKETFYNLPAIIISTLYIVAQNVNILFNYNNELKTLLIVSSIILLIYLIIIIPLTIVKKNIKEVDDKIKTSGEFIKQVTNLLNDISTENIDEELVKELKKLKEKIKYSDPVSSKHTEGIEKEIKEKINGLKTNLTKQSLEEIEKLVVKRNTICKDNK